MGKDNFDPTAGRSYGARNPEGHDIPSQAGPNGVYVQAKIPAGGYATIYPFFQSHTLEPTVAVNCTVSIDGKSAVLENEYLRVVINATGQITGITDKESGTQLAGGLCNNFKMYKDVNISHNAWEIGPMYESLPVEFTEDAEILPLNGGMPENEKMRSCGELFAGSIVKRDLHHSKLTQRITLESGSRRMDFHTVIDWQEQHKLLKVEFPVNVYADEALHEIQFGYVKRPTHKSRCFDADRYEVSNHRYTALAEAGRGFAVLNDCKYGVNANGRSNNLTLLKAPVIPDMYVDKGEQEFTYSFYAYNRAFADSGATQSNYELNAPVLTVKGAMGNGSLFTATEDNKTRRR